VWWARKSPTTSSSRFAVGQTIKIGTQEFRVVGVLEKREQFLIGGGSDDQNNVIYVPFTWPKN
jgi:hypothetical protein